MQFQWRVGSMRSVHSWELFGRVISVSQNQKGHIFALDNQYTEVRVFDEKGRFLFAIGEKGEGPGSFMYPEWIAIDQWDTVYVTDRVQRKIEVFAPKGNAYVYERTILLPQIASGGICVDSSSIFISTNNMYNDSLIYRLDKNGNVIGKFGNISYRSENPVVRSYITRNYISCNLENEVIVLIFRYAPIFKVYSREGKLLWQVWIDDLNVSGFTEFKTGGVGFSRDKQEINLV
ncbi:MAG: 6-bladed beta-propeller [Rhodothermus sp.]|nr:6-bladed beta-propeller [Rhodothermus sp.]